MSSAWLLRCANLRRMTCTTNQVFLFCLFIRFIVAKATFKNNRTGELPLASQLLAAIRVMIANDDRAVNTTAAPAVVVEPPTSTTSTTTTTSQGHVAVHARTLAAQVDQSGTLMFIWTCLLFYSFVCDLNRLVGCDFVCQAVWWCVVSSKSTIVVLKVLFSIFLAQCDVALASEWLRAARFDLAAAYAGEASCSAAARNRIVSGLLRAELYSQAFPFLLNDEYRGNWSRITLHDAIAAVAVVQLNELSIADFFVTALASAEKIRKRRIAMMMSMLKLFRRSKCTVNEQTTLVVTRAWFALETDKRPPLKEAWGIIESLLMRAMRNPPPHGAPVNCPTLILLASQARDPDELAFVESLAAGKGVPVGGDLCVALVRTSLALTQIDNADRIAREAGLRMSSDMWAQVIAVFDKAGRTSMAMQLLFQQEQSWSLPTRNACARMLLAIARTQRTVVVKRAPAPPPDVAHIARNISQVNRASPTAIQSLMARAGYPYNARVVNAMVRANASSLWTAAIGAPLRYAQERSFRIDHITFHRAIGANFSVGNMGAALVLWRMYAQMYPQLHGAYLEKSVQAFMISLGLYHQMAPLVAEYFSKDVQSDLPIVEWRWRTGNESDMASLDLFCETAAVPLRTKPSTVKKYALQHLSVERSDAEPLDYVGAYVRFQKVHHTSRRGQHARDNRGRHPLHPRAGDPGDEPSEEQL